ncbi:MAG: phospholipid scramblase family protein [Methanosarcinaceae archaeon]|nr:phospholipid scramblase family protein [Methanosarcinaceae archaeon]
MLDRNLYLIKEHARILKLVDRYDIFDPQSGEQIGIVKDEPSSFLKYMRLVMKKRYLPTTVNIYENEDAAPVFSIRKHMPIIRSKVQVIDGNDMPIGYFKSKILTIGGGFNVFDMQDNKIANIKGDWKGWNFKFLDPKGAEIGTVTKKWAGIGKELFTTADTYMISIDEKFSDHKTNMMLLAAGLAIDVVFKER